MNHEESKLQQQCVAWFRAQYPHYAMLLVHPINEGSGHTQMDRRRQGIHKAEGAVAGVPDLILFVPSMFETGEFEGCMCHGLGIEMKTVSGRQSQDQKDFQKMFEAVLYRYVVVRSLEDFRDIVKGYIDRSTPFVRSKIASVHQEITKAAEAKEREHFYKVIGKKL